MKYVRRHPIRDSLTNNTPCILVEWILTAGHCRIKVGENITFNRWNILDDNEPTAEHRTVVEVPQSTLGFPTGSSKIANSKKHVFVPIDSTDIPTLS